MIVATIELAQRNALGCTDERARRFQKQARALDMVNLVVMMQIRIAEHFFQVLLVVHRGCDNLSRVCDRTQQRNLRERNRPRARRYLQCCVSNLLQIRDQYIMFRKRIMSRRKDLESFRYVPDYIAFYKTKAVFIKAADLHVLSQQYF